MGNDLLCEDDHISNSQLIEHADQAELESQFKDLTSAELLHDVQVIESRLVSLSIFVLQFFMGVWTIQHFCLHSK